MSVERPPGRDILPRAELAARKDTWETALLMVELLIRNVQSIVEMTTKWPIARESLP